MTDTRTHKYQRLGRPRALDERRRALIRATHEAPRPPLAQLGAVVVLLAAVILLFAQWEIYPVGQTGQGNGLRALGAAVVAGLAAFRLLLGQPGRHRVACGLVLLAGAGLLLQAFLLDHVVGRTVVTEAACGVLVVLGGLTALVSPDRGDRR
jgi:hypothetical protein